MTKCLTCSNLTSNLLCLECKKNPFRVEELRNFLAAESRLDDLKKTYVKSYGAVKDINSATFWDTVFKTRGAEEIKSPMTADRIKEVIQTIKIMRGRLLDVGFGWGFVEKGLLKLKKDTLSFYGIDISKIAITEAKKTLPGKFIKSSIFKIPFPSDYFDIVVSLEVLEHVLPFKTFRALNELWRVLKRGSFLIISVPLNEGLEAMYKLGLNPNGHVRVYTPELIKAELKIAGFKILREKYFYAFNNLYWLKNFLRRTVLKNRWQPNVILLVAQRP